MDQGVVDRVRALLRLADRNTNAHEAAAAAAAAQRLIAQHGLDEAVLAASEGRETLSDEEISDAHEPLARLSRKAHWRGWLANAIGRANRCRAYWRGGRELRLVGRASDVAVASWLYAYCEREIDRLCALAQRDPAHRAAVERHGARAWGGSFRVGAVRAISDALSRAREEAERPYAGTAALTLVREADAAVDRWMESLRMRPSRASQARQVVSAQGAGYEAGRTIDVHRRPLGAGASGAGPRLLGGGS